jgi:solute carrier family 25 S-adenosylmethionine transporter 26
MKSRTSLYQHIAVFLALFVATADSRRWAPVCAANPLLVSHRQRTKASTSSSTFTNPIKPSVADVVTLTISQRLVSGGCSRGIAQLLLYPMDALRTLAQTRDGRTLADVGTKALVRGCATTSSFAILIGSIQFAIFGATRDSCGPVISSALGAAGSCLVSVPQEVIKQRLVTGVYSNFRSAVATIYKTEGVRGFYSAWRPTVARNIPFVVATFTAMDYLKRSTLESKRKRYEIEHGGDAKFNQNESLSLTVVENLVIGISSSLIGATLTHPADVIKTRMMTQAASKALPYSSTMDCIQTIWRTEGVTPFYSGFAQRSAYMGPLWAIQFALNGKFSTAFKNRNSQAIEIEQ